MIALVNFVSMTVAAQLVFFAKVQLHATNTEVGLLFSASGVGIFLLSLLAGPLRRHWPFSRVALGLLEIQGFVTIVMAQLHMFWAVLPLIALWQGLGALFTINTTSLRQAVTPNHLLGRVVATAGVLGGAVIPIGSLLGGFAIEKTGSISLVFSVVGALVFLLPVAFSFTALGHAERYVPAREARHSDTRIEREVVRRWVDSAAHPVTSVEADGEQHLVTLDDDDLERIRAGLASMQASAGDIARLLLEMTGSEPGAASLRQTLEQLRAPVEDLNYHWTDVTNHLAIPDHPATDGRQESGQAGDGIATARS